MKRRTKRPYKSLQDWMERTRTNQTQLAAMTGISQSHLSYILTGGKQCSLKLALLLSEVTGVPVQNLAKWKRVAPPAKSEQSFKSPDGKVA